MSSAVVTIVLLVVMLLIVASLFVSAWCEHQRATKQLLVHSQASTHPLERHGTTATIPSSSLIPRTRYAIPSSWYTQRRTLVSLAFLLMIMLTLLTQGGFAGGTLQRLSNGLDLSLLNANQPQSTDFNPVAHPMPSTPSIRLVRIDSASRSQYYSDYQLNVWSYSSCSGIAMEMVMNAYGRHLVAADVLQEELTLGVWDVHLGLLREEGISLTADYFGFTAALSHSRTLQDIIDISNKGTPVIVGVRDSYYFPGGHIMVVRGGDSQYVYTADSSPANFQRMTRGQFQAMWQGFSAVLTPK